VAGPPASGRNSLRSWLTFTGILFSLHDVTSSDVAVARLGQFTDTEVPRALAPDSADAALRFIAQPD
jgi:hypothetical protein